MFLFLASFIFLNQTEIILNFVAKLFASKRPRQVTGQTGQATKNILLLILIINFPNLNVLTEVCLTGAR